MKELALLAISYYSGQFTYQSFKKACGLSSLSTVKNYIDYLQESFLIFVLEPYSSKIKARISLPKKIYVIDIALVESIIPKTTEDLGKKLENIVFIELKRRALEIYYINTPQYEIDFALKEGRKITELIQVAWSIDNDKARERELKALATGAKEFSVKKLLLITEKDEDEIEYDGLIIHVVSITKWLLNI